MARSNRNTISIDTLIDGINRGDRLILSKAITIIESQKVSDQIVASELIDSITSKKFDSLRLGISGAPGVGKSTFIEALGLHLVEAGKKIAVLTVDPSSTISHGSILGDKTRMNLLSQSPNAFIRPSPAGNEKGGVNHKTRESILLCEAAGFDVIIVETVGVGQSEVKAKEMVDFFLVLMLAGGGDELQGIKRGIMELADGIAVNKADGDNKQQALIAKTNLQNALHYFPPHAFDWQVPVEVCSSIDNSGISSVWSFIEAYKQLAIEKEQFFQNRNAQNIYWLNSLIEAKITELFYRQNEVLDKINRMKSEVKNGNKSVRSALRFLFD